ncbi:MAG: MaoC family dehydratase [Vulcanimicrobiaceae bacterium]
MTVFPNVGALAARLGSEAGRSAWLRIDQARIDTFAAAAGDRQWIHVDCDRAARESPYGTTVAHGFLTVALLSRFIDEALVVESARLRLNYGFDRLRFLAPVRAGAEIRGVFGVAEIECAGPVARVVWDVAVEIRGSAKPALAARWISQIYEHSPASGV